MAKAKSAKKGKKMNKKRNQLPVYRSLDDASRKHVAMLLDPCNATLAVPAYEGPGGGYLVRLRRTVVVGNSPNETAGVLAFYPGVNMHFANGAVAPTTGFNPTENQTFAFLNGSSTTNTNPSFRCVAGCITFRVNASELNRAGIVTAGLIPSQYYADALGGLGSINTADVMSGVQNVMRAPEGNVEVKWLPTQIDQEFQVVVNGTVLDSLGRARNGCIVAFTGFPGGSGITAELTAIYEVVPYAAQGFVATNTGPASRTPFVQTLRAAWDAMRHNPVVVQGLRAAYDFAESRALEMVGGTLTRAAPLLLTA